MSRPTPVRPLLVGLLLAGLLLVGTALLPGGQESPERPVADRTGPIAVLRDWDADRAAAWREGDLSALADLYVEGSAAGRADRAMLASWVARGLRVEGMRMQVAAAEVVEHDDDRAVLVVTDRLGASAVAVGRGRTVPLPSDRWSTREVVLVRAADRWRVESVTPQARPAAMTASTSASENS